MTCLKRHRVLVVHVVERRLEQVRRQRMLERLGNHQGLVGARDANHPVALSLRGPMPVVEPPGFLVVVVGRVIPEPPRVHQRHHRAVVQEQRRGIALGRFAPLDARL